MEVLFLERRGVSRIINNCYYDESKFKETSNKHGTPLTTAQFANKDNFKNWDFENVWIMKDGYPELRIFVDK